MGKNQGGFSCSIPGMIIVLLLLAFTAVPVLAGDAAGQINLLPSGMPNTDFAGGNVPPTLEPTSILDYPGLPQERPPSYDTPLQLRPEDHYWFNRPIPSTGINWIDIEYRYGTDLNGTMSSHAGVDLPAKAGTPVLAAADGVVNWAGVGLFYRTPNDNDPYGNAISIRHDFGYRGQPLFTVYAHLRQIDVQPGQRVSAGEQIGIVGNTGHSTGPHLHFEVRLGEDSFYNTRNPELWLVPPEGYGILAGRIESASSWLFDKYPFKLTQLEKGPQWNLLTYSGNVVHPDDLYQENFVVSDLPAGTYLIDTWVWWKHYYFTVDIVPGQTTFVLIHSGISPVINPPISQQENGH